MKVGRNDPCPCGSGLKYKKCCLRPNKASRLDTKAVYAKKYNIRLKTAKDVEAIRAAGNLVLETLDQVEAVIRAGMKTDEIDALVDEYSRRHGGIPAPLNYRNFPKSVCVSVNEVICHGIPGQRVLMDGDIVNVDVTTILNGYFADASKTYFIGQPDADARKIVSVARTCLELGRAQVKPGNTIGDIGWAIQQYAESQGCSVVREFVGHGVGFEFHEPPPGASFRSQAYGCKAGSGDGIHYRTDDQSGRCRSENPGRRLDSGHPGRLAFRSV